MTTLAIIGLILCLIIPVAPMIANIYFMNKENDKIRNKYKQLTKKD